MCRDDLTVEVIFFGDGVDERKEGPPDTGAVKVNLEATANGTSEDMKAKL